MRQFHKNPDLIWIVWDVTGRRTHELCKYFEIKFFELKSGLPRKLKILSLIIQTLWVILTVRPRTLVVASMRIAALLVILKPLFRYFLVVDCHYSGIVPGEKVLKVFHPLYSLVHRKADLIIVTNKPHADYIHSAGGTAYVLQDRIPTSLFPSQDFKVEERNYKKAVCICSYNSDEPINEIFLAAKALEDSNVRFYLTGNNGGKFDNRKLPVNLHFTGFLPDDEYWKLLWEADLIIDLTTRENCLVCGAYEAVAVERPMILSDTGALKGYFVKGAQFCENLGDALAQAVMYALDNSSQLKEEIREFKQDILPQWERMADSFIAQISKDEFSRAHYLVASSQRTS